jgi:hypothetical protein
MISISRAWELLHFLTSPINAVPTPLDAPPSITTRTKEMNPATMEAYKREMIMSQEVNPKKVR